MTSNELDADIVCLNLGALPVAFIQGCCDHLLCQIAKETARCLFNLRVCSSDSRSNGRFEGSLVLVDIPRRCFTPSTSTDPINIRTHGVNDTGKMTCGG